MCVHVGTKAARPSLVGDHANYTVAHLSMAEIVFGHVPGESSFLVRVLHILQNPLHDGRTGVTQAQMEKHSGGEMPLGPYVLVVEAKL